MFTLSKQEEERAEIIHRKSIICEMFGDAPIVFSDGMRKKLHDMLLDKRSILDIQDELWSVASSTMSHELITDESFREQFKRIRASGGVTAVSTNCGMSSGSAPTSNYDALIGLARWLNLFQKLQDTFVGCLSSADILKAKSEGKMAIIMNLHNAAQLGDNLDNIELYYDLGVRQIALTYNFRTLMGDGCAERANCGLSEFGMKAVEKFNEFGVLIDVSHASRNTLREAAEYSKDPTIASHQNCYAVAEHDRNLTDEDMHAIAEKGGIIGLTIIPDLLTETGEASVEDLLRHIDYAVKLIGVDHVGLGLDSPGVNDTPREYWDEFNTIAHVTGLKKHNMVFGRPTEGFVTYSDWPTITKGLVAHGYSDQEIEKILGDNFLKVFQRVCG